MPEGGSRSEQDPDLWDYELESTAERDLSALYGSIHRDALDAFESLRAKPEGVALRRYNNLYRIYFGNNRYRIIFRLDGRKRLVTIVRVRPRRTAYKGMKHPRH